MTDDATSLEIPIYRSSATFITEQLGEIAGIQADQCRRWDCPCCGECAAIIGRDSDGRVWLAPAQSVREQERNIVRLDHVDEIDEIVSTFPCEPDRWLLVGWLLVGLRVELAKLFETN